MTSNPWTDLPTTAPFVAPVDAEYVARYNATVRKPEHKLHTNMMPVAYLGGLESAAVVFLVLNPGYSELDELRGDDYRDEIRNNLQNPHTHKNFVHMDEKLRVLPNGDVDAGYIWWTQRTRQLAESCGDLRGRIMTLEWFPYPSQRFKQPKEIFPSQRFTFDLLRQAIQQGKMIVIMRCARLWYDAVPELETYPNKLELSNPQSVYISQNNIKNNRFPDIVRAVSAQNQK